MQITLPVSPYIATLDGSSDVVLSLVGLVPPPFLRFPARPEKSLGTDFRFRSQQVDVQTLVDLGMSGAITFSTRMKASATYFLSSLASVQSIENTCKESVIEEATFAVGLNIGIFATNVDANANLSVVTVASKAELHQASTSYQVTVLGAGLETISTVRPLIANSTGPFTAETLQTIGAIQGAFSLLVATDIEKMTPVITHVTIETEKVAEKLSGDLKSRAKLREFEKACTFALERAYRHRTADNAVADAPKHDANVAVVRQIYKDFLGLEGNQPVTAKAHKDAETVLHAGRF